MTLTPVDWGIVLLYFALTIGIGFYFTRRGGSSVNEYFIGGRKVRWWLAGASMVATTFAADTPLAVTGLVVARGVAGNWLWWSMAMSGMLTVFFFARLWRRARVLTDVEFAEVRYSGKPAAVLRVFRALYLALPINLIILGWVHIAMVRVLEFTLGIPPMMALVVCFAITVTYAVAAGLWAVLWTDLIQFLLMMTASIVLAIFAVKAVGGMDALLAGLEVQYGSTDAALSVLPVAVQDGRVISYAWLPVFALVMYLFVQWWATWYPGAEPGGGGYVAQRIFSARTERDGMLATLLFQIAHYALRPWPWIVTALAAVVLYPELRTAAPAAQEAAYVRTFVDHLPTPWRGVMLAGFIAAYMSTISTHLNWGASYLVNDVYRRFLGPGRTERHYVTVARFATVLIFLASLGVYTLLDTVAGAWWLLISIGAGTGLVLILRWYWWRVNAWSEISAMLAAFVASLVGRWLILPRFTGEGAAEGLLADGQAAVVLATLVFTTIVWLVVTFATRPEPAHVLESFYRRVRPGGPGWNAVSVRLGFGSESIPGGRWAVIGWMAGLLTLFSALFGIGRVIFRDYATGLLLLGVAGAGFAVIAHAVGRYQGMELTDGGSEGATNKAAGAEAP
jgi:solute:Na+ symporter, SSS family